MNSVNVTGRLTRDPETRTLNSGKVVCEFSVAVPKRFKPRDGSPDADFFRVKCWGQQAEFAGNYFTKGRLVAVSGRLEQRRYEASDGSPREVIEIVAESVEGLDRPRDDAPAEGYSASAAPPPATPGDDEYDPFADE